MMAAAPSEVKRNLSGEHCDIETGMASPNKNP